MQDINKSRYISRRKMITSLTKLWKHIDYELGSRDYPAMMSQLLAMPKDMKYLYLYIIKLIQRQMRGMKEREREREREDSRDKITVLNFILSLKRNFSAICYSLNKVSITKIIILFYRIYECLLMTNAIFIDIILKKSH